MITPEHLRAALGWLGDLPHRPVTDYDSAAGKAWLQRLGAELSDVKAAGPELVEACRALARAPGAFHPTPGQIAEAVVAWRLNRAHAERETEWRQRRTEAAPFGTPQVSSSANAPAGFARRNQAEFHARVVDLIQRGHRGPTEGGETYVAAVLREEAEEAAARASGEAWRPTRYGPSLLPKGYGRLAGAISGAFGDGGSR